MAAPTLSEIQGIKGDAQIGAAGSGLDITETKPDNSLQYLQTAAQYTAQADKAVYDQYQENLKNTLSNINSISTADVFNPDFKDVQVKYAGLLKDISQNYDIIRNPQKNIEKSMQLKQAENDLRMSIDRSKAQGLLYKNTQQFLKEHEAWNTPQNQKILSDFVKSSPDQRQVFELVPPFNASITAFAKAANDAAKSTKATSGATKDGKYIQSQVEDVYDPIVYEATVRNMLNSNDSFGRQAKLGFEQMYNALPEPERAKYEDVTDFVVKNAVAAMGKNTVTASKTDENQYGIQSQAQAFTARQNAISNGLRQQEIDLQREIAGTKGKVNPATAGAYKNQLLTSLFTTGQAPTELLQNVYGDNNTVKTKVKGIDSYSQIKDPKTGKMVDDRESPIYDGTETTEDMKRIAVIGSKKNADGTVSILRRDNKLNKDLPELKIGIAQANSDFNNILGATNAAQVADGSRKWLKQNLGTGNYDLEKAQKLFDMATGKPATYTETYPNSEWKGKKINVGMRGGKYYNIETGEELKK